MKTGKLLLIIGVMFTFVLLGFLISKSSIKVNEPKKLFLFEESNFYKEYYNSKSNLIVLNIWATWCVPCVEEMPVLNSIKDFYKTEQIDFLSMSIDKSKAKINQFNKTDKFDFEDITINNFDQTTLILNKLDNANEEKVGFINIKSRTVPVTYLIKNKKILKRFEGTFEVNELKEAIEKFK